MSVSQVSYPIVSAFVKAEEVLGPNRVWSPKNPRQELFLREIFLPTRDEVAGISELTSGYELTGLSLAVYSTLDLLVKWLHRGIKVTIRRGDEKWEGVRLGEADVGFLKSASHPHPIVRIPTQSEKDFVYMAVLDEPPDPLKLTALALSLLEKPTQLYRYRGVRFPMVDLRHRNDVRWIVGMETTSKNDLPVWVEQASQETKLRMNEVGAHVKSTFRGVFVIAASLRDEKPDYIINQPFLLVFSRQGLRQPLAVLYITEGDWKNPGTLDFPD